MSYIDKYLLCFSMTLLLFIIHTVTGLECFVCHGRQDKNCGDPYEGNRSDAVNCERIREVGLGFIAASVALGANQGQYKPLSQPPHVCFKLDAGGFFIRGCSNPDFCQNFTVPDQCLTCAEDTCNRSSLPSPHTAVLLTLFGCFIRNQWLISTMVVFS